MVQLQTLLQGFTVATSEGNLSYCTVTLLRGAHTTLVDVGYFARGQLLVDRLGAVGLEPGDIDRIVLTHAHWDHCLNLQRFPNAEVLIHRAELEYTAAPHPEDYATPIWIGDMLGRYRVRAMQEGDELEPGVRLLSVPGHSPGSMAVLVETADGIAGLVGDALPTRASAEMGVPRLIFWDEDAARRSARRLIDTCRFMYPGHDRPFRVESGSFHYIEPTSMTLMYPPRDEDGTVRAAISEEPAPAGPIIVPSARRAPVAGNGDG
jgi:glyoxylase-like metal-dependent hydrolase (beta-lactamase superfamily II)